MAKLEAPPGAGAGGKGAEATAEERGAAAEVGAAESQAGGGGDDDVGGGDDDDDFFGELERGKKAAKEAAKAKKKGRQASVAPTQAWPAVHLSPQAKPYGAPFEAQPKLSGHFAPSLANPNPNPNPNPNLTLTLALALTLTLTLTKDSVLNTFAQVTVSPPPMMVVALFWAVTATTASMTF